MSGDHGRTKLLKCADIQTRGVIPIHLMELSPGSLRAFVVGTSYQLGNLVSSASSTIEATIGERFPLEPKIVKGKPVERYAYGKVVSCAPGILDMTLLMCSRSVFFSVASMPMSYC